VRLAARGTRNIDETEEKIEDTIELARVRRQARGVVIKGFVTAVPLTLLAYLLPAPPLAPSRVNRR
jgi:hypothetical protein